MTQVALVINSGVSFLLTLIWFVLKFEIENRHVTMLERIFSHIIYLKFHLLADYCYQEKKIVALV